MDRCQYGDLRMRVEISSSTAVGPDWRRLIGTLRSDWSTEAWLGCGETVASFDIAAAPSLVDRQAHAADGLLTSGSTPPPAFPERRFQWRCGGRLPGHSGEDRAGFTPASGSSVAWVGRYACSTTRTKSSTVWNRSILLFRLPRAMTGCPTAAGDPKFGSPVRPPRPCSPVVRLEFVLCGRRRHPRTG